MALGEDLRDVVDQIEAMEGWPKEVYAMCYMSKADGLDIWELRDCCGSVVFSTNNRSSVFFFAANREANIVRLH